LDIDAAGNGALRRSRNAYGERVCVCDKRLTAEEGPVTDVSLSAGAAFARP